MVEEQTAADAFALLSDDTRVDVLRAVAVAKNETEVPGGGLEALSFSEIYDRVDVDNTSKLSYHLGELVETYLRKGEDGYSFTHAGERMVRFILAENYTAPEPFDSIPAEGTCVYCGANALVTGVRDQYFLIECTDCGRPATGYVVTPAQTRSRTGADLLDSFKRTLASEYGLVRQGICPVCSGPIDTEVIATDDASPSHSVPFSYVAIEECRECLRMYSGPLTYAVAYHPASVAFHWDHGVDVTGTGMWEFNEYVRDGDWSAERCDEDDQATDEVDATYEVVLRLGDDALRCFLDADAHVTRTERVRGRHVD